MTLSETFAAPDKPAGRFTRALLALVMGCSVLATQSWAAPEVQPPPPGTAGVSPRKFLLESDPADLKRYREENARVAPPAPGEQRVVFLGDSITDEWGKHFDRYFPGKPYIGRGITSETTQQMLIRFRPDVIALQPKVVVILAGTNDIAGNTGRSTQQMIQDNLVSMIDLAEFNHIRVVLVSVLPAFDYWWSKGIEPADKIVALNQWMKEYATKRGLVYVDCHTPMSDERHGLLAEYSPDGVHPSPAGYAVMGPLVEAGIAQALGRK
jgi:lysophospholipase L1-like esterase